MNIQHLHRNPELRAKLAAEYVLGTLRGAARRRFEHWVKEDFVLRAAVSEWQGRLQPMAEFSPAIQPPPAVWRALEQRLHLVPDPNRRSPFWLTLRENLAFWRGLGMVSSTLAALLIVVLLTRQPESGPASPALPTYVAALANEQAQVALLVTGDARSRLLTVRAVSAMPLDADHSLELWAVPEQGAPRSLGLLDANATMTLPLPAEITPQSIPLLAVSLEPKGGSPNRAAPSGPILYKGAWLQVQG